MIKLSKKSFLIFLSAIVTAAFPAPAMATAFTFDGIGNHTLTSANLSFTSTALGFGWGISSTVLEVNVPVPGAFATVTSAAFTGCTGTDSATGFACDVTATNFPWAITRIAAGTFDIDGIHAVVNFTSAGVLVTLEGHLEGSINNTTHTLTFANSVGLTATTTLGNAPVSVTGDFRDDQNTLQVT